MSKSVVADRTLPGIEALLRQMLEGQARLEAKVDRLLKPEQITEAHEHEFLAAVAEHCGLATFTSGEVARAKSEAIQALLWTVGDEAMAIAALFRRCCGRRIGNVKLTRLEERGDKGIRWRWEPVDPAD